MMPRSSDLDLAVRRTATKARSLLRVPEDARLDVVRIIEDASFTYAADGFDYEIVADDEKHGTATAPNRLILRESDYEHAVEGNTAARRTLVLGFAAFLLFQEGLSSSPEHELLLERLADELLIPSASMGHLSAAKLAERYGVSIPDAQRRLSAMLDPA